MLKTFNDIEELLSYVQQDKEWTGAEATMRNRYPIRFILFDTFADFKLFVDERPPRSLFLSLIIPLIAPGYPDLFPTHTELAHFIERYIRQVLATDYLLSPFSELTRFYPQVEFNAIVKTIKGIEPPADAQAGHIRIYLPIVGMQNKMSSFFDDPQTFIYEYKRPEEDAQRYTLILTDGTTYDVQGLSTHYTIVSDLTEWLNLWTKGEQVQQTIICSSRSIFASANNAQPDNAFDYTICHNAYQFLTEGLHLDFCGIPYHPEDNPMWQQLASHINLSDTPFNLHRFIQEHLDTTHIDTTSNFLRAYIDCSSTFERWLLRMYYLSSTKSETYLARVLSNTTADSPVELFSIIATHILRDENPRTDDIEERQRALCFARQQRIAITDEAEQRIADALSYRLTEPNQRQNAIRLLTPLTRRERCLIIDAYQQGYIRLTDLESLYPQLYAYLAPLPTTPRSAELWITPYFDAYREDKVRNTYTQTLPLLQNHNANQTTFQDWYEAIRTVKTVLTSRQNIDIIYWIDGLGVDWLPFIRRLIEQRRDDHIYLNDVQIARAALPTTTAVNRPLLEQLLPPDSELPKIGDIDSFAHAYKEGYPAYIVDELELVEKAINDILNAYTGKTIAFVSDHGMTYLAQYGQGRNLAGINSHHDGRTATATTKPTADTQYTILEDGHTLCALRYDSLATKTTIGHGAHGGATPEEVLVPILIVSNQPNECQYNAKLLSERILPANPTVTILIQGLHATDCPLLEYNGRTYRLTPTDQKDTFNSDKLSLVQTEEYILLHIGEYRKRLRIIIPSTGVEENDDPFGNL